METVYLKTLVVAARSGSFSKAAAQLCITQSAVSQRVKFLEDRYGYQLLDRSGPLLVPTEVGRIVLEKADQILLVEKELEERLKQFGGKARLSLCCTPTFGIVYLPQVLNSFILQNADAVDFKFMLYSPEQAIKGLHDNEFDLGVIEHCEDLELTEFQTFELPKDELIFISAPSLNLPDTDVDMESLLRQRLIARKDGCSSRKLLMHNLAALGRSLSDFRNVIIYDDLRFTIDTVVGGGGIAFVSKSLVTKQLNDGTLREHRVSGFCYHRSRTLALNKNRRMERILQNFIECVYIPFALTPPM
jgi:DNA-binding transcriptional LysR family regulator